jgi:hypothetical protein
MKELKTLAQISVELLEDLNIESTKESAKPDIITCDKIMKTHIAVIDNMALHIKNSPCDCPKTMDACVQEHMPYILEMAKIIILTKAQAWINESSIKSLSVNMQAFETTAEYFAQLLFTRSKFGEFKLIASSGRYGTNTNGNTVFTVFFMFEVDNIKYNESINLIID